MTLRLTILLVAVCSVWIVNVAAWYEPIFNAIRNDRTIDEIEKAITDEQAKGSTNFLRNQLNNGLRYAAIEGKEQIVELLIKHGADVNSRDSKTGWTPLHKGAQGGSLKVAELLLKAGADINATDTYNSTSLNYAVRYGQDDMVEFLLKRGVQINTIDYSNNTPLHNAIERINVKNVELLLKYGADPNILNEFGETALALAEKRYNQNRRQANSIDYKQIVDLLKAK